MNPEAFQSPPEAEWLTHSDELYRLSCQLDTLRFESPEACLEQVLALLTLAIDTQNELAESVLVIHVAECYKHLGRYKESCDLCHQAVATLAKDPTSGFYARALNSLASVQGAMGNTADGLKNAMDALALSEEHDFQMSIARCSITLSYLYSSVGQFESSLDYCQRVNKSHCDLAMRVILTINSSEALDHLGRHEQALEVIDEGMTLIEGTPARKFTSLLINNKACCFASLGRDREAEELLNQSEIYLRENNYARNLPNPSHELGTRYLLMGEYEKAIYFFDRAIALCEEYDRTSLVIDIKEKLATAYQESGRYSQAFETMKSVVFSLKNAALHRVMEENESFAYEQLDWMKREFELLREVNRNVSKAKQAVDASNRLKTELLANISHEIRTPMNGIIGLAKKLSYSLVDPNQVQTVQNITVCGQNLLSIVDDILALAEIENGNLRVHNHDFDLATLLSSIEGVCQSLCDEKNLLYSFSIASDVVPTVYGDESRLRQLIMNFVGNSVKFTHKGSVTVTIHRSDEGTGIQRLRISIADTGMGMSPTAQQAVLEGKVAEYSFNSRKYGGNGLGLMISRNIISSLGGTFGVSSQLGVGTTFWFELDLPIVELEEPLEPTAAEGEATLFDSKSLAGLRVLIAEDNVVNWIVIDSLLKDLGARTTWAKDGREAVELDAAEEFDVILMDCHMPNMDGYEAAQLIREREQLTGAQKAIIALSADVMKTNQDLCRASGMNDFLAKPIVTRELVEHLKKTPTNSD